MDQTLLGIGTRLQHTRYGPGVIVGIRYATYLISFIHQGIIEVDKTDNDLDDIQPENVTEEIETNSEVEKSLLKKEIEALYKKGNFNLYRFIADK